jgi:hypothetical protein
MLFINSAMAVMKSGATITDCAWNIDTPCPGPLLSIAKALFLIVADTIHPVFAGFIHTPSASL